MFPILWLLGPLMAACGPPEPVLPGVVSDQKRTQEGLRVREPEPYNKPKGVYVDVPHFCGKSFEAVRDDLSEQLGDIRMSKELNSKDGKELKLDRGMIRVKDGKIYLVRVELKVPLRRSSAMQAVGLPVTVRKWNSFSREFNTRHHAGYERIRMGRLESNSEAVVWVEVMRSSPRR